jgi:hypothetical protein
MPIFQHPKSLLYRKYATAEAGRLWLMSDGVTGYADANDADRSDAQPRADSAPRRVLRTDASDDPRLAVERFVAQTSVEEKVNAYLAALSEGKIAVEPSQSARDADLKARLALGELLGIDTRYTNGASDSQLRDAAASVARDALVSDAVDDAGKARTGIKGILARVQDFITNRSLQQKMQELANGRAYDPPTQAERERELTERLALGKLLSASSEFAVSGASDDVLLLLAQCQDADSNERLAHLPATPDRHDSVDPDFVAGMQAARAARGVVTGHTSHSAVTARNAEISRKMFADSHRQ